MQLFSARLAYSARADGPSNSRSVLGISQVIRNFVTNKLSHLYAAYDWPRKKTCSDRICFCASDPAKSLESQAGSLF
jgi:hypothetical protein